MLDSRFDVHTEECISVEEFSGSCQVESSSLPTLSSGFLLPGLRFLDRPRLAGAPWPSSASG